MSKLFYNNVTGQAILQDCTKTENQFNEIDVICDDKTNRIIDKDNNELKIGGISTSPKITTSVVGKKVVIKNQGKFNAIAVVSPNDLFGIVEGDTSITIPTGDQPDKKDLKFQGTGNIKVTLQNDVFVIDGSGEDFGEFVLDADNVNPQNIDKGDTINIIGPDSTVKSAISTSITVDSSGTKKFVTIKDEGEITIRTYNGKTKPATDDHDDLTIETGYLQAADKGFNIYAGDGTTINSYSSFNDDGALIKNAIFLEANPDNDTIKINGSGELKATGSAYTFNVSGDDPDTTLLISNDDTLKITGGTGISTEANSTADTVTVTLDTATTTELGGIKIGYPEIEENYAVQLETAVGVNKGKAYVTVPSNDYTAGDGLTLAGNEFSLNEAEEDTLGGIKIGYPEIEENYAVQLETAVGANKGKAYVTVPSNDYTAGDGLTLAGNEFSLNEADEDTLGGIKIGYPEIEENYAVQLETAVGANKGKAYVTVPSNDYTAGDGLTLAGNEFSLNVGYVPPTSESVPTYPVDLGTDGDNLNKAYVKVPIASNTELGVIKVGNNLAVSEDGLLSSTNTTYTAGDGLKLTGNDFSLDAGISDLNDVTITGAATGEILMYTAGITNKWKNTTFPASSISGANPTATIGATAIDGLLTTHTFMRSDAAPALGVASITKLGGVKVDGTTIDITAGGKISTEDITLKGNLPATALGTDIISNGGTLEIVGTITSSTKGTGIHTEISGETCTIYNSSRILLTTDSVTTHDLHTGYDTDAPTLTYSSTNGMQHTITSTGVGDVNNIELKTDLPDGDTGALFYYNTEWEATNTESMQYRTTSTVTSEMNIDGDDLNTLALNTDSLHFEINSVGNGTGCMFIDYTTNFPTASDTGTPDFVKSWGKILKVKTDAVTDISQGDIVMWDTSNKVKRFEYSSSKLRKILGVVISKVTVENVYILVDGITSVRLNSTVIKGDVLCANMVAENHYATEALHSDFSALLNSPRPAILGTALLGGIKDALCLVHVKPGGVGWT